VFKRLAESRLKDALGDTPVVVVQGPRQCGKTTLVRQTGLPFVTLDDALALDFATRNPDGFIAQFDGPIVIDEVQRAPGLFMAIKKAVDADRRPGRFLLTGSSNVLLLPRLSESLAGRMETVPLWPLSQAEIGGGEGGFVSGLFRGSPSPLAPLPQKGEESESSPSPPNPLSPRGERGSFFETICRGGFPEAVSRGSMERVRAWFESYVTTVTERDVRDLADIEGLTAMPRLLRVLARHCGETLNVSRLSREVGIPHTTLTRYLSLLESVFVLRPLAAWSEGPKSAKTGKVMFADSGVLCSLLGVDPSVLVHDEAYAHRALECFVAMEVLRLLPPFYRLLHFRSLRTWSVPIVVESPDGRIVGIDLCLDSVPPPAAFRGLEVLQEIAGERFVQGIVLYLGEGETQVSERLRAVGIGALWE
jgi:predicted AAA+ superfamily ATPase